MPWKNGGGSTRTLAVSPEGAGFDAFDWRISIADVGESGDFSLFPGVDRTILLLEGNGMTLKSGGSAHELTAPFEPWSMAGDTPTQALLVNGPCRDFNAMARRGRFASQVRVWRSAAALEVPAGEAVFYCAQGAFTGYVDLADVHLKEGWAVRIAPGTVVNLRPALPDSVLIGVFTREERS